MNRHFRKITGILTFVFIIAIVGFAISINQKIKKIENFIHVKNAPTPTSDITTTIQKQSQEEIINKIIERMSVEEKIGQLIMVNYYGNNFSRVKQLIDTYHVGGLMLKSENIKNKSYSQVKNNNKRLLSYSKRVPLFISVDQEGGDVARLDSIIKSYPSPREVYNSDGKKGIEDLAKYFSEKLDDLNIQINFAPTVDVIKNNDSIVNNRIFSKDSAKNGDMAKLYIEIFNSNNIIAAAKHYPGYGTVSKDPHTDICRDSETSLDSITIPFAKVVGSAMIMTSHVIFSKYSEYPSTISKKIISQLREKYNYSNIIITDDIQMKSITKLFDYEEASVRAINAGCDIVLSITKDESKWYSETKILVKYLIKAYKNNELSKIAVDNALRNIIRTKLQYVKKSQWTILETSEKSAFRISSKKEEKPNI